MNNQFSNDINRQQSLQESKKENRMGSKNIPGMEEFVNKYYIILFQTFGNENGDPNDYINSYNYYIYYNSINPKNESLPKPTYKPSLTQELDFMNQAAPNSEMNNMNGLTDMMNNLSLKQRNYDNNSNFSLFINEQNKQIMNKNN